MEQKIELLTFVSGCINGVDFQSSGGGFADPVKGITKAVLLYDKFPEDFTPLKCKSWKCKHHPAIAEEIDGGKNFFTVCKGNYDVFETIKYPGNQAIYSSAKIRRIDFSRQVVISRFDGFCTVDADIARQLPYDEIMRPGGRGKAMLSGERTVMTVKGAEIKICWEGEIQFLDRNAELPFEEIIHYEPLAPVRFLRKELRYEKEMKVTIAPRYKLNSK